MRKVRIKDVAIQIKDGTHGSYIRVDEGLPLLSAKNIKQGKVIIEDESLVSYDSHQEIIKPKSFKKGDVLFTTVGTLGEVAILEEDNLAFQRSVASLRIKPQYLNKYIYWSLKNIEILEQIKEKIKTTAQSGIYLNDLSKLFIYSYDLSQQTAIANYLDHHTTKIDKEISLLEQKVEKLDEYKQALIYETVTRGLDKNVPMKDSGIDWIGMIPGCWEVRRLKDITCINKGKSFYYELENENGYFPYINGGINPSGWTDVFNAKENTIAVSEGGASAGYSQYMNSKYWAGDHCYVVKTKINCELKYLFYIFKGYEKNIMSEKKGSAMPNLQKTKFVNYSIPFNQNKNEQNAISDYLDHGCSVLDEKKELINKKIELLKEYKQSLVYEAVTGKIKVGEAL